MKVVTSRFLSEVRSVSLSLSVYYSLRFISLLVFLRALGFYSRIGPCMFEWLDASKGSALVAGSAAYWKALQPHRKLDEADGLQPARYVPQNYGDHQMWGQRGSSAKGDSAW